MGKDVIIACDFPSKEKLYAFLDKFGDTKPFLKVGMELYYAEGAEIVRTLKARGHKVFLDLKLHDIPNTVKSAMKVLANVGADIVNLHAAGGSDMMKGALAAFEGMENKPMVIAVTQLTSTDKAKMNDELLIPGEVEDVVKSYAKNACDCGLNGVVCSPKEGKVIKEHCGKEFLTVTPGIRFADAAADDQKRVTTPLDANKNGSDYIVVGRPITAAEDPLAAYNRCMADFTCEV